MTTRATFTAHLRDHLGFTAAFAGVITTQLDTPEGSRRYVYDDSFWTGLQKTITSPGGAGNGHAFTEIQKRRVRTVVYLAHHA